MIYSHIKKVALSLQEESFQCEMLDHLRAANENLEDSEGPESSWMRAIRQQQFKRKLRTAEVTPFVCTRKTKR